MDMSTLPASFIQSEFWLQVLRFLLGSTILLGGVYLAVRLGWLRQLRLQSSLWKCAVVASLLLLMPITSPLAPAWEIGRSAAATLGSRTAAPQVMISDQSAVADQTASFTLAPTQLALLLWIVISGTALLRLAFSRYRDVRLLDRRRVDAQCELRREFKAQCQRLGIAPLPVLTLSEHIQSPVAVRANEVCLPAWMVESMSVDELSCVIAHELGHIRNNDVQLINIMQVLECIFFFQPLLRLARRQLMDLAEFMADQAALGEAQNPDRFTTILLDCARRIQQAPFTPHTQGGIAMVGKPSRLRSRIEQLLGEGPFSTGRLDFSSKAGLALILAGSVFLVPSFDRAGQAFAQGAQDTISFEPVACTVEGYESIVDEVHAGSVSAQHGLARWEQHCGAESGREIDQTWQQFGLEDHHLWFMANIEGPGALANPALAAMYRALVSGQAGQEAAPQQQSQDQDTSHQHNQ